MRSMFEGARIFDAPLFFTSTAKVLDMRAMFAFCPENQKLDFDTSSVMDSSSMFQNANKFNKPLNFVTTSLVLATIRFNMFLYLIKKLISICTMFGK